MRISPTQSMFASALGLPSLPALSNHNIELNRFFLASGPRLELGQFGMRRHPLFSSASLRLVPLDPHIIEKIREREEIQRKPAQIPLYIEDAPPPPHYREPTSKPRETEPSNRGVTIIGNGNVDLDPLKDFEI